MKKTLLISVMLMSITTSCVRFDEPAPIQQAEASTETRSGTLPTYTVLPDPYALENVQAVYDSLNVGVELQPTHLHVRFRPQNFEQLEQLKDDYELDLYEYPLDIDIPEGEEYIDPTIPEGEQGWLYTTVEADYELPNDINYEILEE